jgi:hypothetical protein
VAEWSIAAVLKTVGGVRASPVGSNPTPSTDSRGGVQTRSGFISQQRFGYHLEMSGPADRSAWWLAVAGIVGVVAGALITGAFGYFSHNRDLDAKLIELSVGILRAQPTPETTPLREWAVDVIQKRGDFSFTEAQKNALLSKELPFKPGAFSSGYDLGSYNSPLNAEAARALQSTLNGLPSPTDTAPK